jgi:hypothetical protein
MARFDSEQHGDPDQNTSPAYIEARNRIHRALIEAGLRNASSRSAEHLCQRRGVHALVAGNDDTDRRFAPATEIDKSHDQMSPDLPHCMYDAPSHNGR